MRVVQECEASLASVAVLREKEKGAPALAMGGACGRCRGERRHLPWWQCCGDGESSTSASHEGGACGRCRSVGAPIALGAVSKG